MPFYMQLARREFPPEHMAYFNSFAGQLEMKQRVDIRAN